jgi:glutamine synthetase type III
LQVFCLNLLSGLRNSGCKIKSLDIESNELVFDNNSKLSRRELESKKDIVMDYEDSAINMEHESKNNFESKIKINHSNSKCQILHMSLY